MRPRLASIIVLAGSSAVLLAERNVTVDDSDATVRYSNGWSLSTGANPFNFGGFHHLTDNKDATATFTFTGTAIYFKSPLWPYAVAASLKVDDFSPVLIDLQDYKGQNLDGSETVNTSDVWGMTGLSNGQHTLTVSFAPGKQFLVLDALVYTVPDGATSTMSHPPPTTPVQNDRPSQSKDFIVPIVIGASLGAITLILAALMFVSFLRRRRRPFSTFPSESVENIHHSGSVAALGAMVGSVGSSISSRLTSAYIVEPWDPLYGGSSPPIHPGPTSHWKGSLYPQHLYGPADSSYLAPSHVGNTQLGYHSASDRKGPTSLSYVANQGPQEDAKAGDWSPYAARMQAGPLRQELADDPPPGYASHGTTRLS